jgi:hypothetical protein
MDRGKVDEEDALHHVIYSPFLLSRFLNDPRNQVVLQQDTETFIQRQSSLVLSE